MPHLVQDETDGFASSHVAITDNWHSLCFLQLLRESWVIPIGVEVHNNRKVTNIHRYDI